MVASLATAFCSKISQRLFWHPEANTEIFDGRYSDSNMFGLLN